MATPTAIAGYLLLFALLGCGFLLVNLLVGRLLRPADPHQEKLEIYECGEPTIGSSFVQFDLRFYVVALVFIVFDVEVAFLFPLATVLGKASHLADPQLLAEGVRGAADAARLGQELGVTTLVAADGSEQLHALGSRFAWATMLAINVFFAILLIGFFYEWKTGAFDWVRAVTRERSAQLKRTPASLVVETESTVGAST